MCNVDLFLCCRGDLIYTFDEILVRGARERRTWPVSLVLSLSLFNSGREISLHCLNSLSVLGKERHKNGV